MQQLLNDSDQYLGDHYGLSCSIRHFHFCGFMMNTSSMHYKSVAWVAAPIVACSLVLATCSSSDNGSMPLNGDSVHLPNVRGRRGCLDSFWQSPHGLQAGPDSGLEQFPF